MKDISRWDNRRFPAPAPVDELASILECVGARHGVAVKGILGRQTDRRTARARREAMALARHELKWSYPEIGKVFRRHHSTVIAACAQFEAAHD